MYLKIESRTTCKKQSSLTLTVLTILEPLVFIRTLNCGRKTKCRNRKTEKFLNFLNATWPHPFTSHAHAQCFSICVHCACQTVIICVRHQSHLPRFRNKLVGFTFDSVRGLEPLSPWSKSCRCGTQR